LLYVVMVFLKSSPWLKVCYETLLTISRLMGGNTGMIVAFLLVYITSKWIWFHISI